MSTLIYILLFTLIGSVISLIGGVLLLIKQKLALKISNYLSSFAAGTLLGVAFLDLIPESLELSDQFNIPFWILAGVLTLFVIERFIHHHHSQHSGSEEKRTVVPLIIIGDTLHNFADGVAIAATFLISIPLGIVTTFAVAAHEIPQEIADFGLMLSRGVKRSKVIWLNVVSSLSAFLGAILTYIYHQSIEGLIPIVLAVTAGFFIYIAASNLIPEIHSQDNKKVAFWETVMLFLGVLVIYLAVWTNK